MPEYPPTDEIEPMVPRLPRGESARHPVPDGGRPTRPAFDRRPATDHAEAVDRDREEIEPFVPDLR